MLQSATIREIEVIGEAVKNVSNALKKKYPEIPWKNNAGTRDRITHHYFGIDLEIIFNIVTIELPKLKKEIVKIKKDLQN
jgi:uncharacterized protein with HEPN domain